MMTKKDLQKVIVVALLFVALFGSYFIAKYISSLNGSDDIAVAKWSVEAVSNTDTLNVVSGNTVGVYALTVTSTSEVSVEYSIILSNVPSQLEVKIDDGVYRTADQNNNITFDSVGMFGVNGPGDAHVHSLTFNSPLGANVPNINEVDVDVRFTQVD